MAANARYFIIARPLGEEPSVLEPILAELSTITGLDNATLRQRFVGTALQSIRRNTEREPMEKMARALSTLGVTCAVLDREELKGAKRPQRIASIDTAGNSLYLQSKESEVLAALDANKPCLVVLSTEDHASIQSKRLARRAMKVAGGMPLIEVMQHILRNSPVMDIYTVESQFDGPLRLDARKFNYNTLGEHKTHSSTRNFTHIIKEIQRHANGAVLETGFGENSLPFLGQPSKVNRERFLRDFSAYSRFIYLGWKMGLFAAPGTGDVKKGHRLPVIDELGGIIWGGPILISGPAAPAKPAIPFGAPPVEQKGKAAPDVMEAVAGSTEGHLPPPPAGAVVHRSLSVGSGIKTLYSYKKYAKSLGPAMLFYPLFFLTIGSFFLADAINRPEPLSFGALSLGLIFFTHSFVLLKRKRTIENCPTSKIRSMPMGEVEVTGRARPKYYLRSPYTLVECVYYSFKLYKREMTKDGMRDVLKEWGHSANVPFYVEENGMRVLVESGEAIIRAGDTQTLSGRPMAGIFGRGASKNTRVVETVVPAGRKLYVMGFARRIIQSADEKKRLYMERLRSLKADPRMLDKYDFDGDGRIDADEWDVARSDAQEHALLEGLRRKDDADDIAIGAHPSGGLFYISDKHEAHIIRSLTWRVPLLFTLSLGCIAIGTFYVLQLLQNKAILLELKRALW